MNGFPVSAERHIHYSSSASIYDASMQHNGSFRPSKPRQATFRASANSVLVPFSLCISWHASPGTMHDLPLPVDIHFRALSSARSPVPTPLHHRQLHHQAFPAQHLASMIRRRIRASRVYFLSRIHKTSPQEPSIMMPPRHQSAPFSTVGQNSWETDFLGHATGSELHVDGTS